MQKWRQVDSFINDKRLLHEFFNVMHQVKKKNENYFVDESLKLVSAIF